MHVVLLCGGAGKRLWPLSNELRSKLFLELLPSPTGGRESMIGRVCRQLDHVSLLESTLIVSREDQVNITTKYTKGVIPIIGEPYKRGTFTAAAIASLYLHTHGMAETDDIICIAPADVFAGEDFFSLFKIIPDTLLDAHAELALLGTRPTHASDQYGYIMPGEIDKGYAPITRFIEKPMVHIAESLLQQGALWNCGVYAFSLSFMLTQIEKARLPTTYEELIAHYEHLPERSFDKQVAEHTQHGIVIPYDGLWQDIGSWEALTAELDYHVYGNGHISGNAPDSHIVNELPYPIHVIGIPDIVVAASSDGILIADKKQSKEIKNQLGNNPQQPMVGEATWGSYRVIDRSSNLNQISTTTLNISILPGHNIGLRQLRNGCKAWTVLAGNGQVLVNRQLRQVSVGDQFKISSEGTYSITADSSMIILEVRIGPSVDEDQVVVEAENWEEIVSYKI